MASELVIEWRKAFVDAKEDYELLDENTLVLLERYCLEDIIEARTLKDLFSMYLVPFSDAELLERLRDEVLRHRMSTFPAYPTSAGSSASARSDVPDELRCKHERDTEEWCVRPRVSGDTLCFRHQCVKEDPNALFGDPEYET